MCHFLERKESFLSLANLFSTTWLLIPVFKCHVVMVANPDRIIRAEMWSASLRKSPFFPRIFQSFWKERLSLCHLNAKRALWRRLRIWIKKEGRKNWKTNWQTFLGKKKFFAPHLKDAYTFILPVVRTPLHRIPHLINRIPFSWAKVCQFDTWMTFCREQKFWWEMKNFLQY